MEILIFIFWCWLAWVGAVVSVGILSAFFEWLEPIVKKKGWLDD